MVRPKPVEGVSDDHLVVEGQTFLTVGKLERRALRRVPIPYRYPSHVIPLQQVDRPEHRHRVEVGDREHPAPVVSRRIVQHHQLCRREALHSTLVAQGALHGVGQPLPFTEERPGQAPLPLLRPRRTPVEEDREPVDAVVVGEDRQDRHVDCD